MTSLSAARTASTYLLCLSQLVTVLSGGLVYQQNDRHGYPEVGLPPATNWIDIWLQTLRQVLAVEQISRQQQYSYTSDHYNHLSDPRDLFQHGGKTDEFGYRKHNGPAVWHQKFPKCGGSKQSPINIEDTKNLRPLVVPKLQWLGYSSVPKEMTIANTHHTIKVTATWDKAHTPSIKGGPLKSEYVFEQLHFHWGMQDNIGSEHTNMNISAPMEIHAVHYNKRYGSFDEATKHEDGLVVVAHLFERCLHRDSRCLKAPPVVKAVTPYFKSLKHPGLKVKMTHPFSLKDLVIPNKYVTYMGSLTTPPCSEVVTWIISRSPLLITKKELNAFRDMRNTDPDMENNFRPVQPLNKRPVYYVKQNEFF